MKNWDDYINSKRLSVWDRLLIDGDPFVVGLETKAKALIEKADEVIDLVRTRGIIYPSVEQLTESSSGNVMANLGPSRANRYPSVSTFLSASTSHGPTNTFRQPTRPFR